MEVENRNIMKNYILLLLLLLLCGPGNTQTTAKSRQPVKKTSVQTVEGDEKNKEKIGREIRKPRVQRRGDRIKGKKSVENLIEHYGVKSAQKYC